MTDAQVQQPQPAQPQAFRKVGFLLGLGIFFIPYIFGWLTLRKGHTSTARIVSFAWMGLAVLVFAASPKNEHRATAASATGSLSAQRPAQGSSVKPEAQQESIRWLSDSCADVAKQWGMGSKLTELQKKDLWDRQQVAGMHFKWKLKVRSVDSTFGQLQAQFKCENSRALISDMILGVEDKDTALKLVKDETYTIHGVLRDWGNFVGLQGELVELVQE